MVTIISLSLAARAQDPAAPAPSLDKLLTPGQKPPPTAPEKVEVAPSSGDTEIQERLERILRATHRFENPKAHVEEGVVFLSGETRSPEFKQWAGKLAEKTADVVAVINDIELTENAYFDLSETRAEIREMGRSFMQSLPLLVLAIAIAFGAVLASWGTSRGADYVLRRRLSNQLLRSVTVRTMVILVAIIGGYLVLRILGLTQIAVTLLGGTGLFGLIVGIAFRDIAENFLASILVSSQRPFEIGDLVEVAGLQGYVQRVTTRGTELVTLDGVHIQVPNATIYKSVIRNLTSNPHTRLDFGIVIGYPHSASRAQELILKVLQEHEAVLNDPEPLVLVDEFRDAGVSIKVFFWISSHHNSRLKTRSAIMRLTKKELQAAGLLAPAAAPPSAQEAEQDGEAGSDADSASGSAPSADMESGRAATQSEGQLRSERHEIAHEAAKARTRDHSGELLGSHDSRPSAMAT
jgi:small-conductance mechanosensitive channel